MHRPICLVVLCLVAPFPALGWTCNFSDGSVIHIEDDHRPDTQTPYKWTRQAAPGATASLYSNIGAVSVSEIAAVEFQSAFVTSPMIRGTFQVLTIESRRAPRRALLSVFTMGPDGPAVDSVEGVCE